MAGQAPAIVMMEACGSAHYWARELEVLGYTVKLITPQFVKPFVKRQKYDAADVEAIVVAAQRPEMGFVEPKSHEQQALTILFRARERLVRQHIELINALRTPLRIRVLAPAEGPQLAARRNDRERSRLRSASSGP